MRISGIAGLLACGAFAFVHSTVETRAADPVAEINQLAQQGNTAQALQRIDAYLANKPGDVKIRFQKGLLLTQRGSIAEAIAEFTALTRDHPELPEPYNNLAVLHASRGEYDKARAALETAIRINPAYAIAHENLGALHAKLAGQAYDKSRGLDKSNAGKSSENVANLATRAQASNITISATTNSADGAAEVITTLKRWAQAWTNKDAPAYLAFYAPEFKVPDGESRARWEAQRRTRIDKPRKIEVIVIDPKVSVADKNRAEVSFQQDYRADTFSARVNKTIVFTKKDGNWMILEERVLK